MSDVSVGLIQSLARHLLIDGPALRFNLGDFINCQSGHEQLMIDAVDDLKALLVFIRDNQSSDLLTPTQAMDALALAWALTASAGATVRD